MQSFEDVVSANVQLQFVAFYKLECPSCGKFRQIANGDVLRDCPRCHQPARLTRLRSLRCATSRPVPIVQRWKSDNLSGTFGRSLTRPGTAAVETV